MSKPVVIDPDTLLAAANELTDDEVWDKWCVAGAWLSRVSPEAFEDLHSLVVMLAWNVGAATRWRERPATPETWASLGSLLLQRGIAGRDLAIIATNADLMPSDKVSERMHLEMATETAPLRFAHVEHAEHCRIAECSHPPRFSARAQYWCSRCRAVADRGLLQASDSRGIRERPA